MLDTIPYSRAIRRRRLEDLEGYDNDGMLTAEREIELISKWQKEGDKAALDELVVAYHPFLMRYVQKQNAFSMSQDDLYAEAVVGMMKALEKFEIERGNRFSTYLRWRLKASVGQFILDNYSIVKVGASNIHKKLFFSVKQLHDEFTKTNSHLNEVEVVKLIAQHLEINEAQVDYVLNRMSFNTTATTDDNEFNEADAGLLDEAYGIERVSNADEVVARLSSSFVTSRLKDALCILDEREYFIITRRVFCEQSTERTLEDIGNELGITRERVRQIQESALLKMRQYLQQDDDGTFANLDDDLIRSARA